MSIAALSQARKEEVAARTKLHSELEGSLADAILVSSCYEGRLESWHAASRSAALRQLTLSWWRLVRGHVGACVGAWQINAAASRRLGIMEADHLEEQAQMRLAHEQVLQEEATTWAIEVAEDILQSSLHGPASEKDSLRDRFQKLRGATPTTPRSSTVDAAAPDSRLAALQEPRADAESPRTRSCGDFSSGDFAGLGC